MDSCLLQVPMGKSWGDISEGVRVEVPNSDSGLPMKVYWIATIIKLAGTITVEDNLSPTVNVSVILASSQAG